MVIANHPSENGLLENHFHLGDGHFDVKKLIPEQMRNRNVFLNDVALMCSYIMIEVIDEMKNCSLKIWLKF